MAHPMTSDEYKKEWDKLQEQLCSLGYAQQRKAEYARHVAWVNLTFGMNITPEMNPAQLTEYFNTWNKTHDHPPFTPR